MAAVREVHPVVRLVEPAAHLLQERHGPDAPAEAIGKSVERVRTGVRLLGHPLLLLLFVPLGAHQRGDARAEVAAAGDRRHVVDVIEHPLLVQSLGDAHVDRRGADAPAREAEADETVRWGRVVAPLPRGALGEWTAAVSVGVLPARLDVVELDAEDVLELPLRLRAGRPPVLLEPRDPLRELAGIGHPVPQPDVEQRHHGDERRAGALAHVGRSRGGRDAHRRGQVHLREHRLQVVRSAVAGAPSADEAFAEDEEVAVAVANPGVLAGLEVEGGVDQVVGRDRTVALAVLADRDQVDVFLDVHLVVEVLADQIGRSETVAIEAGDRGEIDVDREPAEEPQHHRQRRDEQPSREEEPAQVRGGLLPPDRSRRSAGRRPDRRGPPRRPDPRRSPRSPRTRTRMNRV